MMTSINEPKERESNGSDNEFVDSPAKSEVNQGLIPDIAWTRKLCDEFPAIKDFQVGWKSGAKLALLGWRMWKYVRREKAAGRIPIMDPFNTPVVEPLMGVPLGGIGGGSIGRGWRGDFIRWNISPCGIAQVSAVEADQFSVFIRHLPSADAPAQSVDPRPIATVLHPGRPKKNCPVASKWDWNIKGKNSTYFGLFPRAWTEYREPDPNVRLVCKQVSPVIPHNYKESSYPVGVFCWTIENTGTTDVEISLMFSFQNGMGSTGDFQGGHVNIPFARSLGKEKKVVGITLKHNSAQTTSIQGKNVAFADPLSFAIAVLDDSTPNDTVQITNCTRFSPSSKSDVTKLWQEFKTSGTVSEIQEDWTSPSKKGISIAAALVAKVIVRANSSREVTFSLAWDAPVARFSSGSSYFRRYTAFYGNSGNAVEHIACDALSNFKHWENLIDAWQNPILSDAHLPDYYKSALFNELYYIVDGGTIWTTHSKARGRKKGYSVHIVDSDNSSVVPPADDDIGHFAYLESLEYLMYNTYDVHFYASFALAMLWPKLELSLQRDIAIATMKQSAETWEIMHSGHWALRKAKGAVPHDMGNPGEDPWSKVNSYCTQDISRWKDLPCKFILQIYRDYMATEDMKFLNDMWPVVKETIGYAKQFDLDGDGVLDNENFPDQTYDTWAASGCSAYSGGLWLACLTAAIAIAEKMEDTECVKEYSELLERGKKSYEEKLWNGEYYNYDSSSSAHHDSIMADQLAGQWYAKACGLKPIVAEPNAYLALKTIYQKNVLGFKNGTLGAINGMKPDGQLDDTCMQSLEVWTGTTFALAATMLQQGLVREAFETAKGIIMPTYHEFGYMFQTPEAWDVKGQYRSAAYMRPLCIWAIQWAWEKFYSSPTAEESITHSPRALETLRSLALSTDEPPPHVVKQENEDDNSSLEDTITDMNGTIDSSELLFSQQLNDEVVQEEVVQ